MTNTSIAFYKKPAWIASVLILFCSLFIGQFTIEFGKIAFSASPAQALLGSGSLSGDDVKDMESDQKKEFIKRFWESEDTGFGVVDKLSSLLLLLSAFLIYTGWKGTNDNTIFKAAYVKPIQISILVICAIFFARYMFGLGLDENVAEKVSPGGGLWVSLLASIFILFEDKIMAQFTPAKAKNTESTNS